MFQKFEVNGTHKANDPAIKKYVNKKIGGLDRYVPRHARSSAHAEVHLKESKDSHKNSSSCEITIYLPNQTLIVKEKAINMFAAIDIAEAKLKIQLKKYKDKHTSGKLHRHLTARFLRKNR